MTKLKLIAFAALVALAACTPPAKPDAAPAVQPAPVAAAPAAAPAPRPAAQIPADAPPEPVPGRREPMTIVTAGGPKVLQVEIADSDPERTKGLMFRRSMAPDDGMLFDFQAEKPLYFWMKNTYIPLDMLFMAKDGTIIAIAANTTPLSEEPVGPGAPSLAVLELNAGRAAELGIHPGDKAQHRIFAAH